MPLAVKILMAIIFVVMMAYASKGAHWIVEEKGIAAGLAVIALMIGTAFLIERRGKSRDRS